VCGGREGKKEIERKKEIVYERGKERTKGERGRERKKVKEKEKEKRR